MQVTRLPLTEARNGLGKFATRAHFNGEAFILEKDGIPVAALISVGEFEDYLDAHDPKIKKHIELSRKDYLAGRVRPAETLLAELGKQGAKRRSNKRRARAS